MQLSKFLSFCLRRSGNEGMLDFEPDGSVPLADVLALPEARRRSYTLDKVQRLLSNKTVKPRFQLTADGSRIRAISGHTSVHVEDSSFWPLLCVGGRPSQLVHFGYSSRVDAIMNEGLKPGASGSQRTHVHLLKLEPGVSLPNKGADAAFLVDVPASIAAGVKYFENCAGTILTRDTIPAACLELILVKDFDLDKGCPRGRLDSATPERHARDQPPPQSSSRNEQDQVVPFEDAAVAEHVPMEPNDPDRHSVSVFSGMSGGQHDPVYELSPQSGQSMVKIYLLHKEPPVDPEELLDAREVITPQDNCVAALTGPIEKGT